MSFIAATEQYYDHEEEIGEFKRSSDIRNHNWLYEREDLSFLMSQFQETNLAIGTLSQMGGSQGLVYALRTHARHGLADDEIDEDNKQKQKQNQNQNKDTSAEEASASPSADADAGGNDDGDLTALEIRRELYGVNELPPHESAPFYMLCLDELKDPMLCILVVAGIVSLAIGASLHADEGGYIEGLAILIAVVIVVNVGAINNWQKEKQFRKMDEENKKKDTIVMRAGSEVEIPWREVVVGDLVILRNGFTVPADGVYVLGTENLKSEESSLTGEARELTKNAHSPLLMKGTNIVEGEGLMVVTAVGPYTEWGKLMLGLQEERKDTPLQEKLDRLANLIGYGGGAVAILLFIILTINWAIRQNAKEPENAIVEFLIIAITIVVVAVPEGLPLAVTISLAYSMKKMLLDNNFVRHLKACETMGNATTICSDKTGTLTTNRMSVQRVFMYGRLFRRKRLLSADGAGVRALLSGGVHELLMNSVCANTKSFQDEPKTAAEREAIALGKRQKKLTGGNQTDCAMLQFAIDLGATDYKLRRKNHPITKMFPFDSKVKRSSVLISLLAGAGAASAKTASEVESDDYGGGGGQGGQRGGGGGQDAYCMYVKGAAEIMLGICSFYMDAQGATQRMSAAEKQAVLDSMSAMTCRGLRCLGSCYKMYARAEIPFSGVNHTTIAEEDCAPLFENMVWIAVCGIQDPVREEVPGAVDTCHRAGIVVRMVTGDHLETAKHIAKECHILTCADHVCMTGARFRTLSQEEKLDELPRLRVLARSKPKDKEQLVRWYKAHNNDIVATTGDGANDALALKEADIGLSMGIQGTDVAKEASDIIIMDDNFASIEKTVMWGRSVYDNIRKFVQFQLTVNVVALTISLVAAFWTEFANPLTAVQLLWVNLIMDTMAALALATEDPTPALLNRHPFRPDAPLITAVLWRFVFGHSVYQLVMLLLTMFLADEWLDIPPERDPSKHEQNRVHLTIIFNTFVWMQIFNEFNARRVNNEWNVFENLFANLYFWFIMCVTVVLQVLMVEFFGAFTSTVPLNGKQWGYCLAIGFGTLLWHQVVRLVPVNFQHGIKDVDGAVLFKQEKEFLPGYGTTDEDEEEEVEADPEAVEEAEANYEKRGNGNQNANGMGSEAMEVTSDTADAGGTTQ